MDFDKLETDLESHPITGWLSNGNRIRLPLISHIVDGLYVGGCKNGVDLGDYFDSIYSLYVWEEYKHNSKFESVTMYDSNYIDFEALALLVPKIVADLRDNKKVLVHCQAGVNRSNLFAATSLMVYLGISAEEAIKMLKDRRGEVILANDRYSEFLLEGGAQDFINANPDLFK